MKFICKFMMAIKNYIKHILIFSEQYPTESDPVFAFVGQIAEAFAKLGIKVTVIAPQSLSKHFFRKVPLHNRYRHYEVSLGQTITVYQPFFVSLGKYFQKFNQFLFFISCFWAFHKIKDKPQVCYGHFWHCAYCAYEIARKNNLPLFVASGESKIHKNFISPKKKGFLSYCSGVIFVSTKNEHESQSLGYLSNQNRVVLPNAINPARFFKKDKLELRQKYKVDESAFIVIFVGAFIDRKGPQRVAEALTRLNVSNIKAFFIGSEKDGCSCPFLYDGTLFKGGVSHEILVDYLNMADVFVLPTLAEGCCNAIIEALACGLPVISSNRDFNDDILDNSYSIRVNPESVEQIAEAIKKLYDNPELCSAMSEAALQKASSMTIENRAKAILNFMEDCVKGDDHARMA